jgi:tetratricopeptide (TPR) repeat protein
MASKDLLTWLEFIAKLLGLIAAIITLATAIMGFSKTVKRGGKRRPWALAGMVIILLLAASGVSYYLRLQGRPLWAMAGVFIVPLLTAGGVGYYLCKQARPPGKVIILVANFDGPKPQEYRVTEKVLEKLRLALARYDDVRVKALGQPITEAEGSDAARAEGEKHKAAIVIWGWYGLPGEAVPLSVHFEVLRSLEYMPELGLEAKGLVRTMDMTELESFTLQTHLSAEMAYLSLCTVGFARYAVKDWDGAIARFSDALSQTAEYIPALDQRIVYLYRAIAYSQKCDYDRAITDYDLAAKLKLDFFVVYIGRGLAYYAKHDYGRAIADYDQAVKLKPDFAEAYSGRGLAYRSKGDLDHAIADYDQAIADYDQAIKLKPDNAEAYAGRGVVCIAKGSYQRAVTDFDQAIKLRPDYAEAYIGRGNAYGAQGDYTRSITDYDQAIKLKPDCAEAYTGRGITYYFKGDADRAIIDYNRAIKLDPDFAETYYVRGFAYLKKGDYDCTINDLEHAIKLKPAYAEAYYNRGLAYHSKRDYEGIIQKCR